MFKQIESSLSLLFKIIAIVFVYLFWLCQALAEACGTELVSNALEGSFFTSGPQRKSLLHS